MPNGFELSSADILLRSSSRVLKPDSNQDFRLPSVSTPASD